MSPIIICHFPRPVDWLVCINIGGEINASLNNQWHTIYHILMKQRWQLTQSTKEKKLLVTRVKNESLYKVVKHTTLLLRLALSLWNVRNKIIAWCKPIYCLLSHRNIQMIWGEKMCHLQSVCIICNLLHIPNINLTTKVICHQ
jgi:hypothetical protein